MKIGNEDKDKYHKKISSSMDYIQKKLVRRDFDKLNLEAIADSAHMSPYHFHKVFKSVVGETVADYIRRLKLEKSVGILFYYKQVSITKVAMELGFSSSQNLAKAFKKQFNLTPSDIKYFTKKDQLTAVINKSSKYGNASKIDFSYSNDSNLQRMSLKNMIDDISIINKAVTEKKINILGQLNIKLFPARTVIYKRVIGEYSNGVQSIAGELQSFVTENMISTGDPLVINWDNPEITPAEKCRMDVCLTLNDSCHNPAPFNIQTIDTELYAFMRGLYSFDYDYEEVWQQLFKAIFEQGYKPSGTPCYKIMHLETSDLVNGVFDVSFCQAVLNNK
ncbi:hypothetical protein TW85_22390 [Marinomonas sp. S3726]|uniref:AraC family transcriptional regulator n=1 Tax=Marinomonas sp. S3726 TaxID=579484 RepID=UPI0005FA604B|nr:AraC family transcriptional regulator [Marinomonas sp. S3726]KJZ09283.1 hypothetical protein TW85_22390 [Marinomonas sp. S3726]